MDVDTGVDDALALILALKSPELELRAVTCVSGNVHVDKAAQNSLRILQALDAWNIPVMKGMAKPILRELEVAEDFHGKDGLGDSNLPPSNIALDSRDAVKFLIEETARLPKSLTVVATGPLTNIATALNHDSRFAKNVRDLVIMGGAYAVTPYGYGNINPVAEFNIYVDPEAANIVFKSGIPMTCVGLDVTTDPKATLTSDLFTRIQSSGSKPAMLAARILTQPMAKFGMFHLHDPMAVALVIDPTLFTTRDYHVQVETESHLTRGQTVADRRDWLPRSYKQPPNASVCTAVDGERFLDLFLERITS